MSDDPRDQQVREMRAELLGALAQVQQMNEQSMRMEVLKLAAKVELASFENRDDKRDRDRLNADIQITAGKMIGFVRTGSPQ